MDAWVRDERARAGTCPSCGADAARPVVYGLPDALDHARYGDVVVFAGCLLPPVPVRWSCARCGEGWGELPGSYRDRERERAARWKTRSTTLPGTARAAAAYVGKDGSASGPALPFCLPAEHARLSLLPEVRERALGLFAELGIPWHAGVGDGPSNHLLSSQVQCVNALGQMVDDPARIVRAFGALLDIEEVLQVEPGRHLTFEYIGPTDVFGEVPAGERVRGARCTSVDAAFLHRAGDGVVELVLVEWKYTESYRARRPDPAKDAVRYARYGRAWHDSDGPLRSELLAFEHALDEPLYQLVRQQLLAHELEKAGAEGAGRVRVLHVLPPANAAYQHSLTRDEQHALGPTTSAVWSRLLRRPDRFVSVDPELFLDPEVTSGEYVLRYAEDLVHDEQQLLTDLGLDAVDALDDWLFWHTGYEGDVVCRSEEVELRVGRVGTALAYPFRLSELRALAAELTAEEDA